MTDYLRLYQTKWSQLRPKDIIDGNINSYSVWANNILNRVESFYEIAVIGPEFKTNVTDEITNYFSFQILW